MDNLQEVPVSVIEVWMQNFRQGRSYYMSDLEQERGQPSYEMLKAQQVWRLLAVPLMKGGAMVGFLGVDNPRAHYDDATLLASIQFFVTNSLDRKKQQAYLEKLSYRDMLTGLYNRRAAEAHVDEALLKNGGGMFLVLDIDHFKQVNDRYGHLIGDALLCEAARTLRDIFFPRDIIGRVGGDEFIIYILGGCSQEAVDGRAAQLAERLRKAGRRYGMRWNLSFTLGLAEKQAGDDYISLFDRADQMLLARKKARRARRADSADAGGERSICTDMALIRRELREKDPPKGAFCQDYETFKQIYRFVERGLKRSGQSAYIILMTLTDAQGQFVPLAAREEYMSRLSDDLQASLRSGDLFAPYSGCQYLLMVLGASSENAAVIAGRIHTRFMSRVAPDAGLLLRYDVYPMGELPLQPKG